MIVSRRYFPEKMLDNDENYFQHLEGIISSIDELATMEITRGTEAWHFRIAPSAPVYSQPILYEILKFNNLYQIHLDLSKSMKINGTIAFDISF